MAACIAFARFRRPAIALAALLVCSMHAATSQAQDRPVAFAGGRVLPIAGPAIDEGTVVVAGGKIIAVGPSDSTAVPADAERIDTTGTVLMPGLVDTHSHVGGGWGGDASGPIQPDVRILDSINVRDAGFRKCRAGG
jgi:imidazolonepropionase-like amidohydrolase